MKTKEFQYRLWQNNFGELSIITNRYDILNLILHHKKHIAIKTNKINEEK